MRKARGERRGLAEVAGESHDAHMRVARLDLRKPDERRVFAAVVDQDHLIRNAGRQRGRQFLVQQQHVALLVAEWNDDRGLRRHGAVCFRRLITHQPTAPAAMTPTSASATTRPCVRMYSSARSPYQIARRPRIRYRAPRATPIAVTNLT